MEYEIKKNIWEYCKICQLSINIFNKKYGASGRYSTDNFKKHLLLEHNSSLEEYFEQYTNRPICKCNICNKKTKIKIKGSKFLWREYFCGRFDGTKKWAEEAKITRQGKNNPMFGKDAWNKNLTKENCEKLKILSEKYKGKKISNESKKKMSESAKKRKIHGHTGIKHSEFSKQKMREKTLQRIKDGKFKQTKTKPHLLFGKILNKLNIKFEEEKIKGYWSFDYYIPIINMYVEIDGDYFHSNPKFYPYGPKTKTQVINYIRDLYKNKFCEENNLKLIRFWECDLINNPEIIEKEICKLKESLVSNL